MSSEKDLAVIRKLIERLERTLSYCQGRTCEDFERDTMLQEACVFNVLQIGELSKNGLSEAFVQKHSQIPWRQMYGLRNRIVHGYEGIMLNIVWDTITEDFPVLLAQLRDILSSFPQ